MAPPLPRVSKVSLPAVRPLSPPSPPVAPLAPPLGFAEESGEEAVAGLTVGQVSDLLDRTARLASLDYFEVLKLSPTAVPVDIKRAFYRESRTYHPDRFFQLDDALLKDRVHELYKRVTEAYFVLRDDVKRRRYLQDLASPERAQKLRFTDASEVDTKAQVKREQEEQIGAHPKGRQFFQTAVGDMEAGRWGMAERNLKMALTYEPGNPRYKERMERVAQKLHEEFKAKGESFKIK